MTLEESTMNPDIANVDLSKITALQQKRTIAFINHFVLTNVQFLNNFMKKCEQSFMNFDRKLEKINAAMVLLEARLSSIPELGTSTTPSEITTAPKLSDVTASQPDSDGLPQDINTLKPTEESQQSLTKNPIQSDSQNVTATQEATTVVEKAYPQYDRFLKMVNVGVPVPAVKLKVTQEGLDPNVLDELLRK